MSHEAVCAGDAELARQVIKYRDHQKAVSMGATMKRLLQHLGVSFFGWEKLSELARLLCGDELGIPVVASVYQSHVSFGYVQGVYFHPVYGADL